MIAYGEAQSIPESETESYSAAYSTCGAIYASAFGNYSEAAVNFMKALDLTKISGNKVLELQIEYNLDAMEYEQRTLLGNKNASDSVIIAFAKILQNPNLHNVADMTVPLLLSITEISVREHKEDKVMPLFGLLKSRKLLPDKLSSLEKVLVATCESDFQSALTLLGTPSPDLGHGNALMQHWHEQAYALIEAHILLRTKREKEAVDKYIALTRELEKHKDYFSLFEIYSHLAKYYSQKGDEKNVTKYDLMKYKAKEELINRSQSLSLDASVALYNEKNSMPKSYARLRKPVLIAQYFGSPLLFCLL